jgi:hypothetical protein
MDKRTFTKRREAEAVKNSMRGWKARVVRSYDFDLDTLKERKVWVIECRELGASRMTLPSYLMEDGYVR